jgi:chaperonin GroES
MAVTLQPLGIIVLIKPGQKEDISKGGVIIPDTAQEKSSEGEVIAVGSGRLVPDGKGGTKLEKVDVEPGDIVIYPKFGGTEYTQEGNDYIFMPSNQLLAKKVTK